MSLTERTLSALSMRVIGGGKSDVGWDEDGLRFRVEREERRDLRRRDGWWWGWLSISIVY